MSLKYTTQCTSPTFPNRINQVYPCDQLQEWLGLFWLEPNDDRLMPHLGEPSPTPWTILRHGSTLTEHPEWMDFLDLIPTHADKCSKNFI